MEPRTISELSHYNGVYLMMPHKTCLVAPCMTNVMSETNLQANPNTQQIATVRVTFRFIPRASYVLEILECSTGLE